MEYAELLQQAAQAPIKGWDFGIFGDRYTAERPSWDYRDVIAPHLEGASSALEHGYGWWRVSGIVGAAAVSDGRYRRVAT